MKSCLQQAGALEAAFRRSCQRRFHQSASDALILNRGIDGDRPNACNCRALVKTVAAQNLAARFRNYAIETGMTEHHGEHAGRHLNRRKVRRKGVLGRNLREGLIADAAAGRSVLWLGLADGYR